jgi:hypothetical protein
MNFIIRLFCFSLIALFGCKPKQNQTAWVDPSKISQDNMIELETDLPPAKDDRTQKPRQKSGEKFMVPEGTKLLSRGVEVTSSDSDPIIGELAMITDGNKETPSGLYYVELLPDLQWVQLDLGKSYALHAILVWHGYSQGSYDFKYNGPQDYEWDMAHVYQDMVVQISNNPTFDKDVKTVFNNDHDNSAGFGKGTDDTYIETSEGRWIAPKGAEARYVRLYSCGHKRYWGANDVKKSINSDTNHYPEVEVYGN